MRGHVEQEFDFTSTLFSEILFDFYTILLAQIIPNVIKVITCFILLCNFAWIEPGYSFFVTLFVLNKHHWKEGRRYFPPRPRHKIFHDLSFAIHG